MKICMLTVTSMLFDSRIQNEAKALRDQGYQVTILTVEDQKLIKSLTDSDRMWQEYLKSMSGITTRRIFLRSRMWKALPKVLNQMCQALELFVRFSYEVISRKSDVYHCHDLTPAVFALMGKWIYGAKIVYDAHELEVDMTRAKGIKKEILKKYERVMVRNSALNITVNEHIAGIMAQEHHRPIRVIENRPEYVAAEALDTTRLREQCGTDEDVRIVLYVGNLNISRGVDKMTEALALLPEHVHFYIMGTGRIREFKELIENIVTDHHINPDRVRFIGPFPPDQVLHYLSGADVSVLLYQPTSNNMMFNAPNKLFQSIIAQVPVVASHNQSFPGYVGTDREKRIGVLVDPTSPESIAAGIKEVLDDRNYQLIKDRLSERAVDMSWETEKARLLDYYRHLVYEPAKTTTWGA